jgi:hypothetical protein
LLLQTDICSCTRPEGSGGTLSASDFSLEATDEPEPTAGQSIAALLWIRPKPSMGIPNPLSISKQIINPERAENITRKNPSRKKSQAQEMYPEQERGLPCHGRPAGLRCDGRLLGGGGDWG